jgi:hypothetical protein
MNFRKRGPLESEKCDMITNNIIKTINEAIQKAQVLLDNTEVISTDLIASVKRRGSDYVAS